MAPLSPIVAIAALAASLCACDSGRSDAPAVPSAEPPAGAPTPLAAIPRRPERLAPVLARNTRSLYSAVDSWRRGGARGRPPSAVTLRALYHQRTHILLSSRPRLARATIARLPAPLAAEARDLVAARRALVELAGAPPARPHWRTGAALPPRRLMRWYRRAERRFGVSRRVLAAVNLVETGFNRLRNRSTADARGPMQFIAPTWRAYGLGGDVDDPRDAIMGAANYLSSSGAPRNYRRALYAYNPSPLYVGAVLRYARQMRRDFRAYYVLYSWQVFVPDGSGALRRITGPLPRG